MSSADASDQPPLPTNAEDRKAASALASLDTPSDAAATPSNDNVNSEAVSQAMLKLGEDKAKKPAATTTAAAPAAVKKNVKVDAADVALVVDELEVTKAKATELLKAHDGDAVATLRAAARG
ncbi:hypothetical protein TGAMA5MH_10463 [Trichoderma gamsii]|uniref:Nascent polypeptide-associated complex subunit alpha-like UBA domain-containing protein n=1 Tax=Trichoderma gamsii TaxID=398673 RepID=A0A2K0SWG1_9HYPO|nr:hypothetical protein TGAMA5MH_10463 [Trichoderma gamsii]